MNIELALKVGLGTGVALAVAGAFLHGVLLALAGTAAAILMVLVLTYEDEPEEDLAKTMRAAADRSRDVVRDLGGRRP